MNKIKIVGVGVLVLAIFLVVGCKNLIQDDTPEEKFKETDYLNDFAGIYEATLPGAAEMGRMVTLKLYPDGTCLLAEKDLGRAPKSIRIRHGRWDHSDFPHGIDLHLNTPQGAKSTLAFKRTEDRLVYSGGHFGKDGLSLIRH